MSELHHSMRTPLRPQPRPRPDSHGRNAGALKRKRAARLASRAPHGLVRVLGALLGVRVVVALRASSSASCSEVSGRLVRVLDDGALILGDVAAPTLTSMTLPLREMFVKASHIRHVSWDRSINVLTLVRAQRVAAHRAQRRYMRAKRVDPEREAKMKAFTEQQRLLKAAASAPAHDSSIS